MARGTKTVEVWEERPLLYWVKSLQWDIVGNKWKSTNSRSLLEMHDWHPGDVQQLSSSKKSEVGEPWGSEY